MMRRVLLSMLLLMPLVAAGQALDSVDAPALGHDTSLPGLNGQPAMLVPLWRAADGRSLALLSNTHGDDRTGQPLTFQVIDAGHVLRNKLWYELGPHFRANASVSQRSWLSAPAAPVNAACAETGTGDCVAAPSFQLMGGQMGATFHQGRYSLGVAVGGSKPATPAATPLPRVVPNTAVTASGLPLSSLENSTNFSARGRFALDSRSGIDLGASVGRIRLLPGNLLGISSLDHKSLSLGVDSGPVSGKIVGRVVQPDEGTAALIGGDKRWTRVDLGVTWRLPWQGELSFGAQNVWSSGQPPAPVVGPEPDQSRIPYVQYHQDL